MEVTYTQRVEFGDCDPARIDWFPNFFRWIDAASRHFFIECGVRQIVASIAERRGKSFVQRYRVLRGGELLMECDEVRIFAGRREDGSIHALPIPPSIRERCEN